MRLRSVALPILIISLAHRTFGAHTARHDRELAEDVGSNTTITFEPSSPETYTLKTAFRDADKPLSKGEAAVVAVTSGLSAAQKISHTLSHINGMAAEKPSLTYSRSIEAPNQHESALMGKFCYSDSDCDPDEECGHGLPQMGISPLSTLGMPGGRAFEGIAKQVVNAPFSEAMMCAPRTRPSAASTAAKREEGLRKEEGLKDDLQAVLFKHKPMVICNNPTVVQNVGGIPRALDVSGDNNDLFNVTIPTGDSLFVKVSTLFPKKQTIAGRYLFDCTMEGIFYEKFAVEVFDGFNSFQVAINVCMAQFDCIAELAIIDLAGDIQHVYKGDHEHHLYAGDAVLPTPSIPAPVHAEEPPYLAQADAALRRYRKDVGIYSSSDAQEDEGGRIQQHQEQLEKLQTQLREQNDRLASYLALQTPPPVAVPAKPFLAAPNSMPYGPGMPNMPTAYFSKPAPPALSAQYPAAHLNVGLPAGLPTKNNRHPFPASAASDQVAAQPSTLIPPSVTCAPTKVIAAKVRDQFRLTESDLVIVSGGMLTSMTLVLTAGPNKGKQLSVPQEFECDTVAKGRIEFVAISTGPGGMNTALCSQQYECSQNQPPAITCLPNNRWNINVGTISSITNSQVFVVTDPDNSVEELQLRVADKTGLMMGDSVIHFQCPGRGEFVETYLISAMDGIHSSMRVCEVTYVCLVPQTVAAG